MRSGLLLNDNTRSRFDHRRRNGRAVLFEQLSHSYFDSKNAIHHKNHSGLLVFFSKRLDLNIDAGG